MLIPTWWRPQGPCRGSYWVNSFWFAGRLVWMRASKCEQVLVGRDFFFLRLNKIFVKNIERISKLYYPYRDLLRKNTAYRSKNLLQNIQDPSQSLKNQRISKRRIPILCIPLEHTFITDTFISTFSPTKLDFFKEELPLSSSRAKGHPTSLNHNIIGHVHIHTRTHTHIVRRTFSHESNGQRGKKRGELFNPRVELSFAFPRRRGHVPVAHPGEWTGTRFA